MNPKRHEQLYREMNPGSDPAHPMNQPPAAGAPKGEVAAHTPTPWLVLSLGNHGLINIRGCDGRAVALTAAVLIDKKGNEANAAFIVRACNAHAGLVEALRAILHDHSKCVACEQPGFLTDSQVDLASAALAAAKP